MLGGGAKLLKADALQVKLHKVVVRAGFNAKQPKFYVLHYFVLSSLGHVHIIDWSVLQFSVVFPWSFAYMKKR